MLSPPIAEKLNVIEQIGAVSGMHRVPDAMHPFMLQAVKEALGRQFVTTVFFTAHRAHNAIPFWLRLKGVSRILTSTVGRMDDTGDWLTAKPCHVQTTTIVIRGLIDQLMASRLNRSRTAARYNQPSSVQI